MEPLKAFGSEDPAWNYVMLPNSETTPSPQIGKARVNFPAEMLDEPETEYRPALMARRNRSMSAWSEMSSSWRLDERMSMYFFRLHNLRRAQEEDKKKKKQQQQHRQQQQQQRTRRGTIVHRYPINTPLTLAPSRLFERPPLIPSDSLDEVALQIPRLVQL